jgi:hypothetical protein
VGPRRDATLAHANRHFSATFVAAALTGGRRVLQKTDLFQSVASAALFLLRWLA